MSGYGFGCPTCMGSGLIGGYAGQKNQYAALDDAPMTATQRKNLKAALRANFQGPPKKDKATRDAERIIAYEDYIKRGGPKPKAPKARTYTLAEVKALAEPALGRFPPSVRSLIEEYSQ